MSVRPPRPPFGVVGSASLIPLIVLCSAAPADQLFLHPGTKRFYAGSSTNRVFVHLVNDSPRRGLQFDLIYDPALAEPISVEGTGRLQDPGQLYHAISPPGVLHVLIYDESGTHDPLGAGAGSLACVTFAIQDVPGDTLRLSMPGALAATAALDPVSIQPQSIGVPVSGSAEMLAEPLAATSLEDGSVRVQWAPASDAAGGTMNLYRSAADSPERTRLNHEPLVAAGAQVVVDRPPGAGGVVTYELMLVTARGEIGLGRVQLDRGQGVPTRLALYQNAPNPFTRSTVIRFDLPRHARVRLAVQDVAGHSVRVLQEGDMPPGRYSSVWDGRGRRGESVASGIYFYVLQVGQERIAHKAIRTQ